MNFSRLQMQTSISDLQEIIGKSGRPGFVEARSRFTMWFASHPETTLDLVSVSIKAIEEYRCALLDINHRSVSVDEVYPWTPSTLSPYGPIYIFLTYVFLCACATAMTPQQKEQLNSSLSVEVVYGIHRPGVQSILASLCGSVTTQPGKGFSETQRKHWDYSRIGHVQQIWLCYYTGGLGSIEKLACQNFPHRSRGPAELYFCLHPHTLLFTWHRTGEATDSEENLMWHVRV